MKWHPELAKVHEEVLAENTEMQAQFKQAMADRNHEVACDCLHSMIVQSAGDYRVGMAGQLSVCGTLRARRRGAHSPPWFDAVCREKCYVFMGALRAGLPLNACELCGSGTRSCTVVKACTYTKTEGCLSGEAVQ